jgi:hypothetical protein
MATRRPRMVLGFAIGLLVVVLALFGSALLRANADDRRDAERRFADRANAAAALTGALFTTTAGQAASLNERRYGAAQVKRSALEEAAAQGGGFAPKLVLLDARGVVLQSTKNTPLPVLARIARRPPHVRSVLDGRRTAVSDVLPDGSLEYVAAFKTDFGRRVIVQGLPGQAFALFLGGFLGGLPGADTTNAYLLDSRGHVVASPVKDQPPGSTVRETGLRKALGRTRSGKFGSPEGRHAYAVSPIAGTPWRVVLSTSTDDLYAGVSSVVEWVILAALAMLGVIAVFLLARQMRSAAAVHDANERLAASNAELERSNVELQRSNADLEQFASVASHDLQEPLRKVQTFGDQLERRFAADIPPEGLDYLRRMRRSASRMSTLIEDLLRFSRVTTHARPPEHVDIGRIAREVTSDLDAMVQETHASVAFRDLPAVEADPLRCRCASSCRT